MSDLKVTINMRTDRRLCRADIRRALASLCAESDTTFVNVTSVEIEKVTCDPEPIIIASNDCTKRLAKFSDRMSALLNEFDLELVVDPGSPAGVLSVLDRKRPDNADYPAVAFCTGINWHGAYQVHGEIVL